MERAKDDLLSVLVIRLWKAQAVFGKKGGSRESGRMAERDRDQ
jgi:hypothetical protein